MSLLQLYTRSSKELFNAIAEQHQEGIIKYPYVTTRVDNKDVEFELVNSVLNQYVHVNTVATRVQFKLLLKRFTNLFGNYNTRYPETSTEYEWQDGHVLVSLDGDGEFGQFGNGTCPVHVQIDLYDISQETLDRFLDTQVNMENVSNIFEEMYMEMCRKTTY